MNVLTFRESREDVWPRYELLVDGEFIGALVGGADGGIPAWLIKHDLPITGEDRRMVCVCECGEYGCGNTTCRVERIGDRVCWTTFDGDVAQQRDFVFPASDYDAVVAPIVARADVERRRDA